MMCTWSRTGLPLALTLAAAACVKNPATGERQLVLVPEGRANALGADAAKEIVQSVGLVDHAEATAYVSRLGEAMAQKSERPELKWSFQLLDDPAVNAFALPGGHIFVTRGILAHLGSAAELAGVLGHEIGHVTGKHSVDQMSKATLAQLGLGIGSAVSEDFAKVAPIGAAGMQVLFLKYGRDDEYQADELGVRYASRAGYDVREMPKVFETLKRVSKREGGGGVPEWLSTHPDPANRIERIREHIAKVEGGGKLDREPYLRMLDGLVYGEDPREGYFEDARFIHPQLGFQVDFPSGWKTSNTRSAVAAQNAEGNAVIQIGVVEGTPEAALQGFLAKEGIEAGTREAGGAPGMTSAASTFRATTQEGALGGLVTFVAHGGKTFGILGLAKAEVVEAQLPAFAATAKSFAAITDPALRNVQPKRIVVVEAPRAMTLADLVQARKASVPLEEIARINAMEPGARLERGQLVKLVSGSAGKAAAMSR
jgi:predicted Zn-dependent protease